MKYAKLIAQILGTVFIAVATAIVGAATDGNVGSGEWFNVVTLGLTAIPLVAIPNTAWQGYAKTIISAFGAAIVVMASVFSGGMSPTEWLQVALAFATALGVWRFTNVGDVYDQMINGPGTPGVDPSAARGWDGFHEIP